MNNKAIKRLSILLITLLTIAVLPSRAGMCNSQADDHAKMELADMKEKKKKRVKKNKVATKKPAKKTVSTPAIKENGKKTSTKSKASKGKVEKGEASYYADKFHGRPTASGEKYNKKAMTAAHKTLPFGTKVRVTNISNGKKVDVIINDRGPFKAGRIIDLSRAAAEKIGLIQAGVTKVTVEIL